ncbi:MAG: hypothetical protein WD470_07280 [Rhodospirillaceae bacterium]
MAGKRRIEKLQEIAESDIASERMGRNSLQGNDQSRVRNERRAVPGVRTETDGIVEGLEKQDKDKRARADLGKGAGKSGDGDK